MNWSADEVADVPAGVVTVISTIPEPAGETAVIWLQLLTVYEAAAIDPNFTAVAPVNSAPDIVTDVPPVIEPVVGEMPVTVGAMAGLQLLQYFSGRFDDRIPTVPVPPVMLKNVIPNELVIWELPCENCKSELGVLTKSTGWLEMPCP